MLLLLLMFMDGSLIQQYADISMKYNR